MSHYEIHMLKVNLLEYYIFAGSVSGPRGVFLGEPSQASVWGRLGFTLGYPHGLVGMKMSRFQP